MILIAGIGIVIGLLLQRPVETVDNTAANEKKSPVQASLSTEQQSGDASSNITSNNVSQDQTGPVNNADELTVLREALHIEIDARKQLQVQLTELNTRIELLENNDTQKPVDLAQQGNTTTTLRTHDRQGVSRPGWINSQALIDAGLDEYQANKIRDVYEDVEMERLYLRDRAIREGWIGDARYRQEREQLDARLGSLKDELNENEYDAFLFATGRPNRVIIESTLSTSPARDAGIKNGDSVIRYNNIRVYTWSDLRDATTKCQTEAMIEVELERNGQRQRVYVPCGPLGVRLDNTSVQP